MTQPRARAAYRELQSLAGQQGGYLTAQQAARFGYGYSHLTYHVKVGNLERCGHGLYRSTTTPISEHDDLIRLSFWSRDRAGRPQAVVSHASALVLHGITLLLPSVVHLSVPPRFQKRPLPGCKLHRATLGTRDVEEHEAFLVTTPLRTIADVGEDPEVPEEELARAATEGLERGLLRREHLERLCGSRPGSRLERALAWAGSIELRKLSRPRSRIG